jgi:hypothetical protein
VPTSTAAALRTMLFSELTDLPHRVIDRRWEIVMTTAVNTLGRYQTARHAGRLDEPLDELVADLVSFLALGLTAPLAAD